MKQPFKFSLQRFAGNTITGHIARSSSGSVLSGNALSFRGSGSFTIKEPSKTFNDYSWSEISAIARAGTGADYFNIGDCKEITLNGNIGDYLTLNNEKLCVFILHFNYPMNGTADNNIILGGFKTSLINGTDIALCDDKYSAGITNGQITGILTGAVCFNINHWGLSNIGGWKGCDLRYDILGATSTSPSVYESDKATSTISCVGYDATATTLTNPTPNTLLAALPANFRNALRLWSRWIEAKGGGSNTEEGIEETIDAITLLTEFEIHGVRQYANEYEQNYQTQMDYYKNGNSKIKYNHINISSAVEWWCSSSLCNGSNISFGDTKADGSIGGWITSSPCGIAPAFKV